MTRTALLFLVALRLPLHAQDSTRSAGPDRPIFFRTFWDAHRAPVRFRPATDSAAPWSDGRGQRYAADTFRIVDASGSPLLRDPAPGWTVEAGIRGGIASTGHVAKGALIGAAVATGAVVVSAITCKDKRAEGPPCAIVIAFTPEAAFFGGLVGAIVGAVLPTREWRRVAVIDPSR